MVRPVGSPIICRQREVRSDSKRTPENTIRSARLIITTGMLICMVYALVVRLFYIQVIKSRELAQRSRSQLHQRSVVTARRGRIRDCRGRIMAYSIDRLLDTAGGMELPVSTRIYPFGDLAGTVLGYVGKDGDGLGAVEYAFDAYLRGEDGWTILQRDGRNIRYSKIGLPRRDPIDGKDVWLTLDIEIQRIAQGVLAQTVADFQAKGGMCIIMDPSNGAIKAMADIPSFNPNFPSRYPLQQRLSRCVGATYEPGSTFKVIAAAAALQEGIVGIDETLSGHNGTYRIFDTVIRDRKPFGRLTFTEALAVSCNICFAQVAEKLGRDVLNRYVREFGFGARAGIELPGEEYGIIKPVAEWSARTAPTIAIGQEISVTFLQMVSAFACIANNGILVTPQIVSRIEADDGTPIHEMEYRPVRRVVSESVARTLRNMMRTVVEEGTGKAAAIEGIDIGGKTGTSQKVDSSGGYSMSRYWSSFVGFVPVDKPILVCGVAIDEPAAGQSGGVAAAPAFRRIMTEILSRPHLDYAERIIPNGFRVADVPLQRCRAEDEISGAQHPTNPVNSASADASFCRQKAQIDNNSIGVPNCVGMDMRDAAVVLLRRGMTPYVTGFGIVAGQSIPAGSTIHKIQVCTLYCAPQKG